MNFVDRVNIEMESGSGGDGMIHFLSEKYKSKGGPDGGDGGKGGDIVVKGDESFQTLSHLIGKQKIKAEDGENGGTNKKSGKAGEDTIIRLPLGTEVINSKDEVVYDVKDENEFKLIRGGSGGRGNFNFASSTHQVPKVAERGRHGRILKFRLNLKLLADIGLVGYPNVGKSSLIKVLTGSKAKVANYPFTTKNPNLGILRAYDEEFIIADVPGLIEGAHKGKGLGDKFLGHIERTRVLIMCLSAESKDLADDLDKLNVELYEYDVKLSKKPQIIVVSKADLLDKESENIIKEELKLKKNIIFVSSVTKKGLDKLKQAVKKTFDKFKS